MMTSGFIPRPPAGPGARILRPAMLLPVLALLVALLPAAWTAEAAERRQWLDFPVDCRLGETCYIQNYVDRDPGPGWQDLACTHLGYDGHKGTDIALADERSIERGVAVRAAADGVVRGVRDGMPDIRFGTPGAPDVTNRECGNGVVIDHGEGWETQYCHLRSGSVAVAPNTPVRAGDKLGEVGQSGKAAFPHLHFEVRKDGNPIDPMDGQPKGTACDPRLAAGATPADPLWRVAVPFTGSGVIALGFTDRELDQEALRADSSPVTVTSVWAPVLVFWVRTFGLRDGDIQAIEITGPDGQVLARSRTQPLDGSKVMSFLLAGVRRPGEAFPAGTYHGRYQALRERDGEMVQVLSATAQTRIVDLRGAEPRATGGGDSRPAASN